MTRPFRKTGEGTQYPLFNGENIASCLERDEGARFLLSQKEGLPPLLSNERRLPCFRKEEIGFLS